MAGKPKHNYQIRTNPNNTYSILAKDKEGKEFWFGSYSLKQAAVRWGDSHKIPDRWPQVVEVENDPFGLTENNNYIQATPTGPVDPIDRSIFNLMNVSGVDPGNIEEVSEFLGVPAATLQEVTDPTTGEVVYQLPKN